MDFSSFMTSLLTSLTIFVVLMFLFTWLSRKPGNRVVYYPNRIVKDMDPHDDGLIITRNPFAWIREAMSSTEKDVIFMSGVDAAVYFVFLTTVLGILVIASILLLPVLLPIAGTDTVVTTTHSTTSNGTFVELDIISMGNIKLKSPRLWAFLIATYWVSFVAYFLLWKAYKHVSDLRAEALMSDDVRPEQYAVLVRDIPPVPEGHTRKEQVDTFFSTMYPDTFFRSLIVTDNRETDKIWLKIKGYKKKIEHAEAVYALSKKTATPEGKRPAHKTGLLGLFGEKVDSINYYNDQITELTPKLEAEQKLTLTKKYQHAALVFFTSRAAAASASQILMVQMGDTWTTMNAPEPRQLIWSNIDKSFYHRQIRQYIVYFFVTITIVFYMIPISLISAFTTLPNLRKLLPFLKPLVDRAAVKTVLEAYLPQIVLLVFLAVLPMFLMKLSKAEGIPSKSHMIRAASGKYFYFTVINVFIGVTVGGTIFNTLKMIEENPNSIVALLARSLPGNATFFLTVVALRFFVGYGLELSRIVPLIIYHLKKKFICKTEAELRKAWAPGGLNYQTRVPADMLIITIVLSYAVISPIILPFGVVYFGLGWLIMRNQVLKVYIPSYESNGRMWPHMHTRILAALILFQITMFSYFGVKEFYYAPILLPLPILSVTFAFVCRKKFYKFFESNALEVAIHEPKEAPNMEQIFKSFIPKSLISEKYDEDDQHENALSRFSRSKVDQQT